MAYCFPPRGFSTEQNEDSNSQQNHYDKTQLGHQGVEQSQFSPTDMTDQQTNQSQMTNNSNGNAHQFPPRAPNANNAHQFPPRAPNPNPFHHWNPSSWGSIPPPGGQRFGGPDMIRGQFPPPQGYPPHQPYQYPPQQFPPQQFPSQFGHEYGGPRFGNHRGGGGGGDHRGGGRGNHRGGRGHHHGGRGGGNNREGRGNKGHMKQQGKKNDKNNNNAAKVKEIELKHNCDTCDRGYKTEDLLQAHLAQHVKCDEPGCKFEAHNKVVQIHKKMQHMGKFKVQWLETPDEIKKWRAERRKKYPTAANVDKKQANYNRKEKSGAVLQTKQFGKMQTGKNKRNNNRQNFRDSASNANSVERTDMPLTDANKKSPCKRTNGAMNDGIPKKKVKSEGIVAETELKESAPLSLFVAGEDQEDSDQEPEGSTSTQQAEIHLAPSGSIGSLGSLAAAYGDSSSSEAEENNREPPKDEQVEETEAHETEDVQPSQKDSLRDTTKKSVRERRKRRNQRGRRTDGRNGTRPSKATLLEMLLAPDVRHERNVLLQCVRYVVGKNFFQELS